MNLIQVKMRIEDLHLLLIYLNGWKEEIRSRPGKTVFKSWNGYTARILEELEKRELIYQSRNSRTIVLTKNGIRYAREIKKKLRIDKGFLRIW